MKICPNDNLSERQFVQMTICLNDNLSEWQFVRMAICPNNNLSHGTNFIKLWHLETICPSKIMEKFGQLKFLPLTKCWTIDAYSLLGKVRLMDLVPLEIDSCTVTELHFILKWLWVWFFTESFHPLTCTCLEKQTPQIGSTILISMKNGCLVVQLGSKKAW